MTPEWADAAMQCAMMQCTVISASEGKHVSDDWVGQMQLGPAYCRYDTVHIRPLLLSPFPPFPCPSPSLSPTFPFLPPLPFKPPFNLETLNQKG